MSPDEILLVLKNNTQTELNANSSKDLVKDEFLAALKANTALKKLHLVGCESPWLAAVLTNNMNLTDLNLSENKIDDEGAKVIANALALNKKLKHFALGGNCINDNGALTIAEALKTNKTLLSVNLRRNKITDLGAKAIIEALQTNVTLLAMGLELNYSITTESRKVIDKLLRRNNIFQNECYENNRPFFAFIAGMTPDNPDYDAIQEVIALMAKDNINNRILGGNLGTHLVQLIHTKMIVGCLHDADPRKESFMIAIDNQKKEVLENMNKQKKKQTAATSQVFSFRNFAFASIGGAAAAYAAIKLVTHLRRT